MFRNLLNPDSGLMVTMAQITDCILLSLLWLLGCFPLFTVGAASAALYDSVRHCLRGSERNPVSRFLRSFRRDFKASLIPTALYLAALWFGGKAMIAVWNGAVYGNYSWALFAGAALVAVLVLGVLSVLFPLLSRFENPLWAMLRNTVLLALANMPRTLALGVLNALTFWLCIRYIYPLFFLPALSALISTLLLEPMFKPYMTENAA